MSKKNGRKVSSYPNKKREESAEGAARGTSDFFGMLRSNDDEIVSFGRVTVMSHILGEKEKYLYEIKGKVEVRKNRRNERSARRSKRSP